MCPLPLTRFSLPEPLSAPGPLSFGFLWVPTLLLSMADIVSSQLSFLTKIKQNPEFTQNGEAVQLVPRFI